MSEEFFDTFKRLDRIQQGASLAGMDALEETHDAVAMIQAANAYLVEHGRRPIRWIKKLEQAEGGDEK